MMGLTPMIHSCMGIKERKRYKKLLNYSTVHVVRNGIPPSIEDPVVFGGGGGT